MYRKLPHSFIKKKKSRLNLRPPFSRHFLKENKPNHSKQNTHKRRENNEMILSSSCVQIKQEDYKEKTFRTRLSAKYFKKGSCRC